VGAGPGGSTTASFLAREGIDVTIVERKVEPEKPVICGEFFPSKDLASRFLPDGYYLEKMYFHFRKSHIMAEHKGMEIAFDNVSKKAKLDGIYIIDRYSFIRDIIRDATNHGAELLTKTIFIDAKYHGDRIKAKISKNGKISYLETDYIIGADAYPSRVAMSFGLPYLLPKNDVAQTITVKMTNVNYEEELVYLLFSPKIAPRTYAWIFPSKNFYNVGVGVIEEERRYPVKTYLERFLSIKRFFKDAKIVSKPLGKPLPVGGMHPNPARDKVLLVGDAAWLVVPTNGGGINNAMLSGMLAADAIINDPKNAHKQYIKDMNKYIAPLLNRTIKYRRGVERLYKRWALFKLLARITPAKWIQEVILGEENIVGKILSILA